MIILKHIPRNIFAMQLAIFIIFTQYIWLYQNDNVISNVIYLYLVSYIKRKVGMMQCFINIS